MPDNGKKKADFDSFFETPRFRKTAVTPRLFDVYENKSRFFFSTKNFIFAYTVKQLKITSQNG